MDIFKGSIEFIFSFALFINALLFIPQAMRIFKEKAAEEVSLTTFLGFLLIQFAIVLHGIINHDYLLAAGYLLSMLSCGTVVTLIVLYTRRPSLREEVDAKEILNQLPGHVYYKDKAGVYLASNANQWKDIGLASLSELQGKTDYDLFSAQEAERLRVTDQEVMRVGQLKILEEETQIASGKVACYLSHKIPLKNKENQIVGLLGVSIDISDAKREVAAQFEMLEKIIAIMPGHVYWVNKEGVYLGCNDNQAKSAGLISRKEIIGKRNQDLPWNFNAGILPETLDKINKSVIETRRSLTVEEPALLYDGTEATFLSNKVPLSNGNGEIIGMVGISIDITERKEAEKNLKIAKEMAEAANEIKTEFLRNMQHDLRTPFAGLLGLADLIESQETDPEKKEALACITESARALLDQLNEIFELVEIESGQLPIIDKVFDIHEIIHAIYNMLLPSAKSKQLDFELIVNKQLPQYVIGDRIRTQRVLINVIANAIKFTKKGGVKFIVNVLCEAKREIIISFLIEDTGIGIPEDKQEMIFERFNRLTSSYSSAYSGKGLGLRIVKQFLDEIGGNVYLTSEVAKGTCFKMLIPYQLPLTNPKSIEQELLGQKEKGTSGLTKNVNQQVMETQVNYLSPSVDKRMIIGKVLVVEDHAMAASIAKTILVKLGCEVDMAETGKLALELAEKNLYDLIFMDIGLPDMDGCTVAKEIRNHPNLAQIPIVALTAHAENQEKQRCLNVGINLVITKPLTKKWAEWVLSALIPKCAKQKRQVKEMTAVLDTRPEKIIDIEYAKDLLGGDEAAVREILTMLIDSLPEEVNALKAAYQQEDWEKLSSIVHKLKGGSSYCGTLRLQSVCDELERSIKAGLIGKIAELYQKVLAEIEAVQKFGMI